MPMIASPPPSATVMLLRDGDEGLEVFMVVRHQRSDVHGGALVFPGGRVDPEDHELAADASLFPQRDDDDASLAPMRVAAVRETFEECGVLFARPRGESALLGAGRLRAIETAHRDAMVRGERSFRAILAAEDLVLAPEAMAYFAHWISPERSPKRFDTRFFLAVAPSDQVALHDGLEAVESVWLTADIALERARAGTYTVVFPTHMNLRKLGRHRSSVEAMEAARASRIVTVITQQERVGDGFRVLRIPREADYGAELFEFPHPQRNAPKR